MAVGFTPRHTESISIEPFTQQEFLALAVEAANKAGWQITYLSEAGFMATTNNGMFSWNGDSRLKIEGSIAHITSESSGSEMIDWGKNRKNVNAFIDTFNAVKQQNNKEQLQAIWEDLQQYFVDKQEDILILPPQSTKQKVKDFFSLFIPGKDFFITPLLIDLNLIIFLLMALTGTNIMEPDSQSLLNWGANFRPMTLSGQWWRLLSSCFIHIGIIHLLLNMYALLYIGALLEPLLGRTRFLLAYILTGLAASTTSMWWHDYTVSAGASGAIFGMYGVFLAMLTTNLIEKTARQSMLPSIVVFVGYNLAFGLSPGIDNAAHIGGLFSGFVIGYGYFAVLSSQKLKPMIMYVSLSIITLCYVGYFYLNTTNDLGLYDAKMKEFGLLEQQAMKINEIDNLPREQQLEFIQKSGIDNWKRSIDIILEADKLNLPEVLHEKNYSMIAYCQARIKSYEYIYRSVAENSFNYQYEIDLYNKRADSIVQKLSQ